MPTFEITLKTPHAGQYPLIDACKAHRFVTAACGRRFGKTEVGKQISIEYILDGKAGWWLMPTYPMASKVWRDMKQTLKGFPHMHISEVERRIELPTGGAIEIKSTHNPDLLRGAGLDFAILDEAAFMGADVWAAVVRPMLMDTQGSALFLSTPFGRNWFWELYKLGLDPLMSEYHSLHFPTSANPLIPAGEIESARATTPERIFREEYLAEFTEDAGSVFRNVGDVCRLAEQTHPISGHRYVFGVDWARDNDFTVIVVVDVTAREMVAIDRFNQIGWAMQRGRLKALADRWQPSHIVAEENSIGSVNIEALQAEGLPVRPFLTTATSKPPLIESLALAMERGEVALLNQDVIKSEFSGYAIERTPSGNYRYGAPAGMHDDIVMATALAWHAATTPVMGRIRFA